MPSEFKDNLPLDGEVRVQGRKSTYTYRGYLCSDVNKCMVRRGKTGKNIWVARKLLTPVQEQVK